MQELLKEKINEFANFLIQNCDSLEKKSLINNKLKNLQLFEIMMFINFLKKENIDTEIDTFIKLFEIKNTEEVRGGLKQKIEYFLQIKDILNK